MNDMVFALMERSRESVEAAELLISKGFYDFAASRAYYAMFYTAEALLAKLNQAYSSHAAVQAAFGREFSKTNRFDSKFHRWLLDAQDMRNLGDYGALQHVAPQEAKEMCQHAREFAAAANAYLDSHKEDREETT